MSRRASLAWDADGHSLKLSAAKDPVFQTMLQLHLAGERIAELAAAVREVMPEPQGELRVGLPENWVLYVKPKAGESRLFLAHPEKGDWVATLSLEPNHAEAFLSAIAGLTASGQAVTLSQTGRLNRFSNLDLTVVRA